MITVILYVDRCVYGIPEIIVNKKSYWSKNLAVDSQTMMGEILRCWIRDSVSAYVAFFLQCYSPTPHYQRHFESHSKKEVQEQKYVDFIPDPICILRVQGNSSNNCGKVCDGRPLCHISMIYLKASIIFARVGAASCGTKAWILLR